MTLPALFSSLHASASTGWILTGCLQVVAAASDEEMLVVSFEDSIPLSPLTPERISWAA